MSPWPLLGSLSLLVLAMLASMYLWGGVNLGFVLFSIVVLVMVVFQWWRDVVRESTFQGEHTSSVCNGMYIGVTLFIVSEVMFFFSFFFGYFFVCLSPDVGLGCQWPPVGVAALSYLSVPLLNTLLLLSSGVSITWAHHSVVGGKLSEAFFGMVVTVVIGVVF